VEVLLLSADGRPVSTQAGVPLAPTMALDEAGPFEVVYLPALWRNPRPVLARSRALVPWLQAQHAAGAMVAAVGTGCCFLAEAGLLDGKAATTHWHYFERFARDYPAVNLKRQFFITQAGRLYCAGSVNSVADLMVHFIRELFGADAARQVEAQFSPEIRRPFEAHSFVEGEAGAHPDEAVWIAQDWMLAHLGEALRMPELAARCGISTRSLNRRFRAALGTTPLAFLQEARTAAARELLEETGVEVDPAHGRELGTVEQDDHTLPAERSLRLTLVAFEAPPDAGPLPLAAVECRWERITALAGYEWPAANRKLNAILAAAFR
jgi:transcriptional regulator GlxA family with amidase domain